MDQPVFLIGSHGVVKTRWRNVAVLSQGCEFEAGGCRGDRRVCMRLFCGWGCCCRPAGICRSLCLLVFHISNRWITQVRQLETKPLFQLRLGINVTDDQKNKGDPYDLSPVDVLSSRIFLHVPRIQARFDTGLLEWVSSCPSSRQRSTQVQILTVIVGSARAIH